MKYFAIILSLMFSILETPCCAQRLTIQVDGWSIQVANNDLPYQMTWREAMNACGKLGNGWRIPNKKELVAMFEQLHQQGRGNFNVDDWYWSSSKSQSGTAWYLSFDNGIITSGANKYMTNPKRTRPVRDLY